MRGKYSKLTKRNRDDVLDLAVAAVRIFTEFHPRPSYVNATQACELLGVSRPTIGRLIAAGVLRINHMSHIPISEIDRILAIDPAISPTSGGN